MATIDRIITLTKQFITIRSIAEDRAGLDAILAVALEQLKDFTIEHFEHNGVKSALVYNTKTRPKKFKLLFNAHLDIIPGKVEQYIPRIEGVKLFGAGAMDMKGNVAALVEAYKEIAPQISAPVAIQFTTDEEVGGFDGTKYQVDQGVRAEFVIATEPTNFDIVHEAKGVLWLKIIAKGKTAHGAYPWRGSNAVVQMTEFLTRLERKFPTPKIQKWVTTVNVSKIETSNTAMNKIPDDCTALLDIRFVPKDAKTIIHKIKALLPRGAKCEITANEPALFTEKSNVYIRTLAQITKTVTKNTINLREAQGSSDARHFARVGGAGIEFGPVGQGIGSDKEWVSIPSLEKYCEILKELLKTLD